jgi:hypothetical protein
MANWTLGRPGQINQTGGSFANDNALFLKLYSGEVLTAYGNAVLMDSLVRTRNISKGKTAQFPLTGQVVASYHVPGTEIVGQATNSAERTINVDDLLIAPVSIANIDEAKTQYDYRSIFSRECGLALARAKDAKLLQLSILASRAATVLTGEPAGGGKQFSATINSDSTVLRTKIKACASQFDTSNVPGEGRHVVLPPALWYLLLEDDHVVNKSFYDTGGSIRNADVGELYNFTLHKSNQVPSTIIAANAGENNTYSGTFTTTVGVAFQTEAIGSLNLLSLATEMEYSVSRQSTLIVSKYSCGHGILRPSNAIELATS